LLTWLRSPLVGTAMGLGKYQTIGAACQNRWKKHFL